MVGAHLPQQCFGLLMGAPGLVQAGLSGVQLIQALIQGGFGWSPPVASAAGGGWRGVAGGVF